MLINKVKLIIKSNNIISLFCIIIILLRFSYFSLFYSINILDIEYYIIKMMPLGGGSPMSSGGGPSMPPGGGGPHDNIFHVNHPRIEQYNLSERQIAAYESQFRRALLRSNPHNSVQLADSDYANILNTEYALLSAKVVDFQTSNSGNSTNLRDMLIDKRRLDHIRNNYLVVMHLEMNNRVPSLPQHISILEQAINLLEARNVEPFPDHTFRQIRY
jgi:hypothetical protein